MSMLIPLVDLGILCTRCVSTSEMNLESEQLLSVEQTLRTFAHANCMRSNGVFYPQVLFNSHPLPWLSSWCSGQIPGL